VVKGPAALRLIVQPCDEDEFYRFSVWCNGQGKPEVLEEKPIIVPLCPPQIPTWTDLGSNAGLRGGRPATNRLSHGTAFLDIQSVGDIWTG
jgi:hypothetical protein